MEIDIPQLKSMIDVASRAARRARGKALRTSLQEFRTWMASEAALPVLHKAIKSPPPPSRGASAAR
eukprot:413840-Pyramimonas_sp.AAC.1